MANFPILTGQGDEAFLKSSGAGTNGDPFIIEHKATQGTHDDLNANANLQVGDADVSENNPVPVAGQVSGYAAVIDVTLSLDTNAYADGDVLADTQEISSAFRVSDGLGRLRSMVVIDQDDQGAGMDIYLLSGNVSFGTENSAVSISDVNAEKILGKVSIVADDYYDLGGVRVACKSGLDAILKAASGTNKLYLAAVSRGTGTYTASGIKLRLGLELF